MDHILDQAPVVSRPRTPSNFALPAPLSSMNDGDDSAIDDAPARVRGTSVSTVLNPLTGLPGRSRRSSSAGVATPPVEGGRTRARSILGAGESLTMSRQNSHPSLPSATGPGGRPILDADQLAARLPPQLAALRAGLPPQESISNPGSATTSRRPSANLGMAPLSGLGMSSGPPILPNNKCSGYFVEPLTWMEPMLDGQVSGKLFCPNEKCGVKIGTYDWAGVQCGCKEWVTPVSTLYVCFADCRDSVSRGTVWRRLDSSFGLDVMDVTRMPIVYCWTLPPPRPIISPCGQLSVIYSPSA